MFDKILVYEISDCRSWPGSPTLFRSAYITHDACGYLVACWSEGSHLYKLDQYFTDIMDAFNYATKFMLPGAVPA